MNCVDILSTATRLVAGDRAKQHGPKEANLSNIAQLWNAYFQIRRTPGDLTAADVATMMALMKIARMELGSINEDDSVDACGYIAIRGEIDTQ